jgi:ABC-2 type transport system permease protein
MNIFKALVMREILDGKNGYLRVPVILAGLTVALLLLSLIGFGDSFEIDGMDHKGIENLGDAVAHANGKEPEQMSAAVTLGYWAMAGLPWVAFPFVVFFSLLGSLYEERRDRSILFWKSMPTADWQEVAAKLFVPIIIAPMIFLVVTIAAQLLIALILSIVVAIQGGPMLVMWPLGLMVATWAHSFGSYLVYALWALPLFAWVALVSSYANRMPFLWAVLAPAVLVAIEGIFFDTHRILRWIAIHLGGWMDGAFRSYGETLPHDLEGPRDLLNVILGTPFFGTLGYTLTSMQFWAGIIIAGGFIYATIEMRKRAI